MQHRDPHRYISYQYFPHRKCIVDISWLRMQGVHEPLGDETNVMQRITHTLNTQPDLHIIAAHATGMGWRWYELKPYSEADLCIIRFRTSINELCPRRREPRVVTYAIELTSIYPYFYSLAPFVQAYGRTYISCSQGMFLRNEVASIYDADMLSPTGCFLHYHVVSCSLPQHLLNFLIDGCVRMKGSMNTDALRCAAFQLCLLYT